MIRPWPLREFLDQEVPRRLVSIFPANPPSQMPDAVISSNPSSWLSEIQLLSSVPDSSSIPKMGSGLAGAGAPVSLSRFSTHALRDALDRSSPDLDAVFAEAASSSGESEETSSFQQLAVTATEPFDRRSFETMCGLQVQGARIVEAFSPDANLELLDEAQSACRVYQRHGNRGATVLMKFDNGMCTILPAIHEFITGLTFDRDAGELIDVSFEPVEYSDRWGRFVERWQKLRKLRAIIAASTRMGTFQLGVDDDSKKISREMQMEKSIDPSLAVYAAYAYRRQGDQDRLNEICSYLKDDLGSELFDVTMLAGRLPSGGQVASSRVLPLAPMLTQGWPMLDAFDYRLPPELAGLRAHIDFNSLWTLYDQAGFDLLKTFIMADKG